MGFQQDARRKVYHKPQSRAVMRYNRGKESVGEIEFCMMGVPLALPSGGIRGTRERGFGVKPRFEYAPSDTFNEVRRHGVTLFRGREY